MQSLFDIQDDEDTKPCGRVLCLAVGCPASMTRAWAVCAERAAVQLRVVAEAQAPDVIADARPAAVLVTPQVFQRNAALYASLGRGMAVVQVPVAPFDARELTQTLSRILERTRIKPPSHSGLRMVRSGNRQSTAPESGKTIRSQSEPPRSQAGMGSYRWVPPSSAAQDASLSFNARVASVDALATTNDGVVFKTKLCITFEEPQSAETADIVLRRCRREVRRIFDGLISGGGYPLREEELAQRLRVRLAGSRPALDQVEVVAPFRMMSPQSLVPYAAEEVGPESVDDAKEPRSTG